MGMKHDISVPTENALIEFSEDGATWHRVLGAASITGSGGDSPTRESRTFSGVLQVVGLPRPPTLEVEIAGLAAVHNSAVMLRDAYLSGTTLFFRYAFQEQVVFRQAGAGNFFSISTAGVLSFTASASGAEPVLTDSVYAPGQVVRTDTNYYVIDSISEAGVGTTSPPPSSQVSAQINYRIATPSVRRLAFAAKVSNFGNISAASEDFATTTLSIAPLASLPGWEVIL